jgi:hypothetical protein
MSIDVEAATQVFVSGALLSPATYKIDLSKLDPGACALVIYNSPLLPAAVLNDILDAPIDKLGGEVLLSSAQVFTSIPAGAGTAFVKLRVTAVEVKPPPPPTKSEQHSEG